jgi:hypothetical protein
MQSTFFWYPLKNTEKNLDLIGSNEMILLGFQYVPKDQIKKTIPFGNQSKGNVFKKGQVHVKVLESTFLSSINSSRPQIALNFFTGPKALLEEKNGSSDSSNSPLVLSKILQPKNGNSLDGGGSSGSSSQICWQDAAALFDFSSQVFTSSEIPCSPLLRVEIQTQNHFNVASNNSLSTISTIDLPIYDFVMFQGHLLHAWYPFYSPIRQQKLGQIKVEIQFLPSALSVQTNGDPKNPEEVPENLDILSVEIVEGRQLRSAMKNGSSLAQDPYVVVEFLGQKKQTKPHIDGGISPIWHETFEFSLTEYLLKCIPNTKNSSSSQQVKGLPVLSFEVLNADQEKNGRGLIGNCSWIVQEDVLTKLKTKDEILRLTGPSDGIALNAGPQQAGNGEIQIRVKRGKFPNLFMTTHNSCSVKSNNNPFMMGDNRVGILYLSISPSNLSSIIETIDSSTSSVSYFATWVSSEQTTQLSSESILCLWKEEYELTA